MQCLCRGTKVGIECSFLSSTVLLGAIKKLALATEKGISSSFVGRLRTLFPHSTGSPSPGSVAGAQGIDSLLPNCIPGL